MTILGCDYSDVRPGGALLASKGIAFAARYVPYGGYKKGLTAAERDDLLSHGLTIPMVFESLAQRPVDARSVVNDSDYAKATGQTVPASLTPDWKGRADAWQSMTTLKALGMWPMPVHFACDWDVATSQFATVDAYLAGAAKIIGADLVGVYGKYSLIEHCAAVGSAKWLWETYAWSGGLLSKHATLYQYDNSGKLVTGVDLDRALVPDFGQFPRPTLPDTATGDATVDIVAGYSPVATVGFPAGTYTGWKLDGSKKTEPVGATSAHTSAKVVIEPGLLSSGVNGTFLYIVDGIWKGYYVAAAGLTITPAPASVTDCTAAVKAATDPLIAKIAAAKTALG